MRPRSRPKDLHAADCGAFGAASPSSNSNQKAIYIKAPRAAPPMRAVALSMGKKRGKFAGAFENTLVRAQNIRAGI